MITIHKNRSAFLPQADRFIGFENDHLVEERLFYVEDEALRDYIFKLDIAESADIVDLSRVSDTTDAPVLRWDITSAVLGAGGTLTAQLRAYDADGSHVWHSEPMEFTAGASVKATKEASDERVITEFEQLETRVEASASSAKAYAEKAEEVYGEVNRTAADLIAQNDVLKDKLADHTSSTDNPHAVTAAQIGVYTKDEVDSRINVTKTEAYEKITTVESTLTSKIPTLTTDLDNTSNHLVENAALAQGAPNEKEHIVISAENRLMLTSKRDEEALQQLLGEGTDIVHHVLLYTGASACGQNISNLADPYQTTDAANLQTVYRECDKVKNELQEQLGTIDTALDTILSIQSTLLGGETA